MTVAPDADLPRRAEDEAFAWLNRALSGAMTPDDEGHLAAWRAQDGAHEAALRRAMRLRDQVRSAVLAERGRDDALARRPAYPRAVPRAPVDRGFGRPGERPGAQLGARRRVQRVARAGYLAGAVVALLAAAYGAHALAGQHPTAAGSASGDPAPRAALSPASRRTG